MTKLKEKKKIKLTWTAILISLLLGGLVGYYLARSGDLDKRTDIVGDGVCGFIKNEVGQDLCCKNGHNDEITTRCIGKWHYISGIRECQYICENSTPLCPSDVHVCLNGEIVNRNENNDCLFNSCNI